MTTLREKLLALKEKQKEVDVLYEEAGKAMSNLYAEHAVLGRQIIDEESLLGKCSWFATIEHHRLVLQSHTSELDKLVMETLCSGYHSSFQLADGIVMTFDDGHVELQFDNSEDMLPFIKKNSLPIDTSSLKKQVASRRKTLEDAERLVAHFSDAAEDIAELSITYEQVKDKLEFIEWKIARKLNIDSLSGEAIRNELMRLDRENKLVEDELVASWHEQYAWYINWFK